MATHKVDSWGTTQLESLRRFFADRAQPGDTVIFDRRLAEENAPSHEGLDDNGCNSWVFRVANQALVGLSDDRIKTLAETVTLRTDFLHSQYPERADLSQAPAGTDPAPEPLWEEDGSVLEEGDDPEAREWAEIVARYT